jgi:hypothetical protein
MRLPCPICPSKSSKCSGQTIAKVVPVAIGLALVFSVLTHFRACNRGTPWWRKKELVTDICYWFFVPAFGRVLRIGLLVLGAGVLFGIRDADELIAFYDNGHGPLARLPLWFQAVLFLVVSDFMLYWLHRIFHRGGSGTSCSRPSGCRKASCPTIMASTIRWATFPSEIAGQLAYPFR